MQWKWEFQKLFGNFVGNADGGCRYLRSARFQQWQIAGRTPSRGRVRSPNGTLILHHCIDLLDRLSKFVPYVDEPLGSHNLLTPSQD